jgi:hypothetical protein
MVDVGELKMEAAHGRMQARATIAAAVLRTISLADLTNPNDDVVDKACQEIKAIVDVLMKRVVDTA